MSQQFTGRVLYANGRPAPNVRVRLYDKDIDGQDDDLTVIEGASDGDGRFTLHYSRERNLDFLDIYLPYLQFLLQINGQLETHHAYVQPFTTEYRLTQFLPVTFNPAENGFQFTNRFPGFWLPYSIPSIPDIPLPDQIYGLCGGMLSAACDFLLAGRPIPQRTRQPGRASPLHQYLHQRQVDSLGLMGSQVVRFARWMALSDAAVQKRTFQEYINLKKQLDQGRPTPIGLVYVSTSDTLQIWKNHQVLACNYLENGDVISIQLYDPNYPRHNKIALVCQRTNDLRLICQQQIGKEKARNVRGFFIMPYTPLIPPTNLTADS